MMALLELRNTPVAGPQESPAQLLMSRRLRSSLPMTAAMLKPQISKSVKAALEDRQARQKYYYDRSAKSLPELKPNDVVRFPGNKSWEPAVVVSKHPSPRSYDIKTAQGTYLRRNRRHLRKTVELSPPPATGFIDDDFAGASRNSPMPQAIPQPADQCADTPERRSRSGRVIRLPARYRNN